MEAIAQDNQNDVLSNTVALAAALVAFHHLFEYAWFVDPMGALFISVYIIYSWMQTGLEQAEMIVGKKASEEFLEEVKFGRS